MSEKLSFYRSCTEWPAQDVNADGGLCAMIDEAREISRRTFLRHVDTSDMCQLEAQLGYTRHPMQGLTMKGDYHVRYFASKLHGRETYYFQHSAIEYVFCEAA